MGKTRQIIFIGLIGALCPGNSKDAFKPFFGHSRGPLLRSPVEGAPIYPRIYGNADFPPGCRPFRVSKHNTNPSFRSGAAQHLHTKDVKHQSVDANRTPGIVVVVRRLPAASVEGPGHRNINSASESDGPKQGPHKDVLLAPKRLCIYLLHMDLNMQLLCRIARPGSKASAINSSTLQSGQTHGQRWDVEPKPTSSRTPTSICKYVSHEGCRIC